MSSNKKYWKSVEELKDSSIVETLKQNEFVEAIPTDEFLGNKSQLESSSTTRRDFLKYVGFSTAAASLAACEGPVIKSIPYVVQPEEIIPGVANFYATTIADGYDFASVLVKTREGRPIKIEHNDLDVAGKAPNARVNASVLGLYDNKRVTAPMKDGKKMTWAQFDDEINRQLSNLQGKQIVLLTQTFASPSTKKVIDTFKQKYGNTRHVIYDTISESAALDAYQAKFGERALANYDFSKATTIVSVGADFLGDWQGGGYDAAYAKGRIPTDGKMSRHIQIEANMTLSGANADLRIPMTPSQQRMALAYLTGQGGGGNLPERLQAQLQKVKSELDRAGSNGILVTGINDVNAQSAALNRNAGSRAFDRSTPITTRQGDDKAVMQLVADMNAGTVGAIIMCGVNPIYSLPNRKEFAEGLKKTDLSICFSMKADETASASQYIAATPHYLESWGDVELKKGHFSLMQPTIRPLFKTRQFQDALLKWSGSDKSYYDTIKETWNGSILGGSSFNQALNDGGFQRKGGIAMAATTASAGSDTDTTTASATTTSNSNTSTNLGETPAAEGLELTLYSKVGMGDGRQANNPWLQEFPDPITRVSWDNYLTVSKADAEELDLVNYHVANGGLNGSYANVTVNEVTIKNVPVVIQPGQAKGSVGLALGYGRKEGLQLEMRTGVNAYPLYQNFSNVQNVTVKKAGGDHEFASVQLHNTLMGRGDIIKETTLKIFTTEDKSYYNAVPQVALNHIGTPVTSPEVDLWDEFDRSIGHHFNLSIDLNACTGCGACVIACHAENNVPVVGKTEVRRSRDMHWLRIDRYYSSAETFDGDDNEKESIDGLGLGNHLFGDGDGDGTVPTMRRMEHPSENPQVAFQPVMCQHCNHAPCETVCPVAATSHGRQGQNHMAYNRCVGTRYCANNCPYKVRRFNWFLYNKNDEFNYHMNNDLGRMVLNPDVVVRSRGVMEKCSMCIQKTQKTILDAKRAGREIKDGELHTACSAACDKGAMVFGDINDKSSKVAKLKEDKRMYHLLESVGTKPNVFYQTKVRNTTEA